jgi:HD-GYP domain-containing protein (c-di-GMP phosphodiesterase class II)
MTAGASPARLAEMIGSLSVATDHAAGLPPETAIKTSLIAVRLARAAEIQGFELVDVYYTGLLRFLGCSAYSYEMAARFAAGDDLSLLRELTRADGSKPQEILRGALRGASRDASLRARVGAVARLATSPSAPVEVATTHCELAVLLARRLGISEGVRDSLGQIYERWDGRGAPSRLRGDAIRRAARVVHVAWRLAAHLSLDGPDEAIEAIRVRAGKDLDPRLVARATDARDELLRDLPGDAWAAFLAAEPGPTLRVAEGGARDVATAFAHFSDVKSPWTVGHSIAVADLALRAADRAGLSGEAREALAIAARLHDLGRVAVRNGIWDKPGALTLRERDEARSHAAESERILARTALFGDSARLAASAHERLDGSGYPHGALSGGLGKAARLLAAADVAVAVSEDRPHRAALDRDARLRVLSEEAAAGRLCPDAVDAVLAASGHQRGRRAALPNALTTREADVIRHVVRGRSNKEIARALGVSAATVKRHLENVYQKTGQRTRAALSVWAVDNDVAIGGEG